ncbi:MAG: VWA domain-containing protein [Methyloprofundus sp.]|nr:VWA domain-containing protein [Methyloprofundus sp.]
MLNKILSQDKALLVACSLVILSGCMPKPTIFQPFSARDINNKFSSGLFTPKTENLYIIIDSSASMNKPYLSGGYQGEPTPLEHPSRFDVSKEILQRLALTIPTFELNTAIRTFGYGSCNNWYSTVQHRSLQAFDHEQFIKAVDTLPCASGGSPFTAAIEQTKKDLQTIPESEQISVLILSDGEHLSFNTEDLIKQLKTTRGNKLCVDTIWLGKEGSSSQAELASLAQYSGCGQAFTAKKVASPKNMAIFVRKTLMNTVEANDISDSLKNCIKTNQDEYIDLALCSDAVQ